MSKPTVIDVPTFQDDRGYVYCALDNLDQRGVKRTYMVENHSRGMIRAWHGHRKAETYMHVLQGAVKMVAMNMDDNDKMFTAVLSERKPQLFYVPAGWYNGSMSLTDGTKILVYSTLSFGEVVNDDERAEWNVNGKVWGVKNR